MLVIAGIMASADSNVVLLAFPDLTQTLHTDVSASIWTILVYMLVTTVLTTQLGRVGDIYGRAKMFNVGFVIFTVASALCGAAPTIEFLIGFRVIQGIGSALLLANSGAIVADIFPREKLGRAYGYIAAGWGAGALLGIVLGGVLTTLLGWRYIFYINVPIGIVAAVLGFKYVKDNVTVKRRLDIFGMLFLGVALTLISYDAISVASVGFSYTDAALIALGVIMIIALLLMERRSADPMIDLSVFKNRVLGGSLLAAMFTSMGYFSIYFMITLYLQGIVGLTPLNAALLLTPGAVIGFLLSPRMGRLSDRFGSGLVATFGVIAFALTILVYMTLGLSTPFSYWAILLASTISGFGVAMFYPANNAAVMSNAPANSYGSMNGLLRTLQNTGGLMSYVVSIYIASTAVPRAIAFQVFVGTTQLLGGLTAAFVSGLRTGFAACLVLMLIAAVLSLLRGRVKKQQAYS